MTDPVKSNHRMEAYLDGRMTEQDRLDFEHRIGTDPDLRAEVERQHAIDAALRRVLDPPPPRRLDALVDEVMRRADRARPRRVLPVAAAVAAAALGALLIWQTLGVRGGRGYEAPPWRSLETVYRDEAAGSFEPRWVCETDAEFAAIFGDRFGQRLLLRDLPGGVESVGLSYCHSLSTGTTYLLARAGGSPVVVFVDRIERDHRPAPLSPDLHLHRRTIGQLVLYEVSTQESPVLLDRFYDPDAVRGPGPQEEKP